MVVLTTSFTYLNDECDGSELEGCTVMGLLNICFGKNVRITFAYLKLQ